MTRALLRHAAFFAAGLLATGAQVLLLRELVIDAAGDEAALGTGLAAWLGGVALGAALARRRASPRARSDAGLGVGLLAVLSPLAILGGRLLRGVLAPDPGELPGLGTSMLVALGTLLPCGAAVGWTFTALAAAAARVWSATGGVTRVYVVESLGSLAGGVLVTALASVLPLRLAALLGALGTALALAGSREVLRGRVLLASALGVGGALAVAAGPLDWLTQKVRFAGTAPGVPLRATLDTPYQHLAVGGDEVRHLYVSGHYAASFPDPYSAESLGSLVAVLVPHPDRVLLFDEAERGLVPVLLRHGARSVTVVEQDLRALAFLEAWMTDADRAALGDPRVKVVRDDPRRFVSRAGAGVFDLVLLLGPETDTLLRARLATVEFFRVLAQRLAPAGAIVMGLRTAPAVPSGRGAELAGTLVRSLHEALPVVRVTPGPDSLVVAGASPTVVTLDPEILAARWRDRGLSSPSFDPVLFAALLPPDRVAAGEAAIARAADAVLPSRDDRPVSFLRALAVRHGETAGRWGTLVSGAGRLPPALLVALAFLPSLAATARALGRTSAATRARRAAAHGVAIAGAAGMGWSLLLLFAFQTHAGALHGQLGALVAVFMLGLAVGGTVGPRALSGGSGAVPAARRVLLAGLAGAFVFSASLPLTLDAAARASRQSSGAALLAYGALLLAAGVATGCVFPVAVAVRLATGEAAGAAAGRVEAADHAGAAVAALFGALLYVPLLGLARTAVLLSALLAVALLVAWLAGGGGVGVDHRANDARAPTG
jgi:spermidine synthase